MALSAHTDTTYFVRKFSFGHLYVLKCPRLTLVGYNYSIFYHIRVALVVLACL